MVRYARANRASGRQRVRQHIRNLIGALGILSALAAPSAVSQDQDNPRVRAINLREPAGEPTVSFGEFSEPIELTTLIDFVGSSLGVNMVVKGSPAGQIVFNAPVEVPRSKLINLLDAMLEQYAFTVSQDAVSGFYIVQPVTDVRPTMAGDRASTRIISTPNIKPSLMVPALNAALGTSTNPGGAQASSPILAVDELGVLIVNAPPRDIDRIATMVEELIRIDNTQSYIRLELQFISAPVARQRAVGLAGGSSGSSAVAGAQVNNRNPGQPQIGGGTSGASLNNLEERITVDPQGNALIFKGTEDEADRVRTILAVIDVPNTLEPKNYFAGSSAATIADIASRRGLGEVIEIEAEDQNTPNPFNGFGQQNNQPEQFNQQQTTGGPVMVVDPARGNIVYYGTKEQQNQLAELLVELGTDDERIVTREYVLNHSDAETVADLLIGIITGQRQTGDSPLLPTNNNTPQQSAILNAFGVGDEASGVFDPNKVSVIPDPDNNQVVIRAPIKQHDELYKIIAKLDKRKQQVYIEAMIVAVNDDTDFLLSVDTQFLGPNGGLGTNFGNLATPTAFTDPRTVAAGLGGLTAAWIKSEYVPIIVNASQTDTDIRILSTPQLLVNDNQEAEIVSIEEQPFSSISQGDGGNVTGFEDFAEAGTTLRVTPSISKSGSLRLEYYIELSNFTATEGVNGSPPPRNTRRVEGSVSVPSDATIVLGGIVVEDIRDSVIKIPFLGDIPLVGEAFKRTSKKNNQSKLYIFLTPRIMTDPNFNDLKLFSEGPQREMKVDPLTPELEPAIIRTVDPTPSALPDSPFDTPMNDENGASAPEASNAPELEPVFIEVTETSSAAGGSD